MEFARRTAGLRWCADQPGRYGDAAAVLWTTFNVVHEHLIRGGDHYMGYTAGMAIRRNRTRRWAV